MNFVQQLEESLRDLAAEARKHHPGVKEASERATWTLRQYKNRYASALRQANATGGPTPTTQLFASSELLHPFLLAANYPNASPKLLEICFWGMRLLLEANAVIPTDAIHLVRVWMIQAQVVAAHYQRHHKTTTTGSSSSSNQNARRTSNNVTTKTTATSTIHEDEDLNRSEGSVNDTLDHTSNNPKLNPQQTASTTSTSSSSWFFWSSSSTTPPATQTVVATDSSSLFNAVSSSTGKTGNFSTSSKEMEKLALDILSSLLQLMQSMHRYYPEHLVTDAVLWKHAVAVVCLCLSPYMTTGSTSRSGGGSVSSGGASQHSHKRKQSSTTAASFSVIQQAAHSTLSQILSLLYETIQPPNQKLEKDETFVTLRQATWRDLLCLSSRAVMSLEEEEDVDLVLRGVFSLCQSTSHFIGKTNKSFLSPTPPTSIVALQVLTKLWRNSEYSLNPTLAKETLEVTAAWLQTVGKPTCSCVSATHAVSQWAHCVLSKDQVLAQAGAKDRVAHIHPVIQALLRLVVLATDSCRSHADFEDGFVYSQTFAQEHHTSTTTVVMATSRSAMTQPVQQPQQSTEKQQQQQSTEKSHHTKPLIAQDALGKASLALDVLYRILNDEAVSLLLLQDRDTVSLLTETMSDFASLAASSKNHILQLVEYVQCRGGEEGQEQQQEQPTSFLRKLEYELDYADWETMVDQATLGEALWISLSGILRVLQCVGELPSEKREPVMELFGPSLAVLQHYFKRFSGCDVLIRLALEGYLSLARLCFPSVDMQKVLLVSLCKLSLPSWGKRDAGASLEDHHVAALLCVFEIMHHFYSHIGSDWEVVLMTLEELSSLSIASPMLTEEAYHAALTISSLYGRVAAFSTCFSTEALLCLVQALCQVVETSLQQDSNFLAHAGKGSHGGRVMDSISSAEEKHSESISKQIMNMGVRAIYGSHPTSSTTETDDKRPSAGRTRNRFYEEYRQEFVKRISESKTTIRLDSVGRVPFTLALVADVAMANTFRNKECGERVSAFLSNLAAHSAPVRPFLMDTIAILTMARISNNDENSPAPFIGPGRIVFINPMQSQLLAVERVSGNDQQDVNEPAQDRGAIPQTEALGPLCESLRTASKPDVAESSLETLYSVLETAGHNLSGDVWSMVIGSLSTLSGNVLYDKERYSSAWSKCALDAFRCLKLIVNDFIDELQGEPAARQSLLECCSSFGGSKQDVNSSLTAITMLWTIADQDTGTDSIDRALAKLVLLASDSRPEIRNASVNTLFSCINGRGDTFSAERWESCFRETIFKVYELVSSKIRGEDPEHESDAPMDAKRSRYKVALHHSRDSESKQWIATQVVVLRGLARVLRTYFTKLLDTTEDSEKSTEEFGWFQDAWVQILDYAYEAGAQGGERDTLDIRMVGVDLMTLCCQLASEGGIHSVSTARVGTNMEVVDGALRAVRTEPRGPEKRQQQQHHKRSHSSVCEVARQNFFLEGFDSLESYVEFLGNLSNPETGGEMDDIQQQVVQKFCAGLETLYGCSKSGELRIVSNSRCIECFSSPAAEQEEQEEQLEEVVPPAGADEGELEIRFIKMIVQVVKLSTVQASARFMNQAQRSCLQLLKTMGKDGSCEAMRRLVDLGDVFFFVKKDPDDVVLGSSSSSIGANKSESVGLEAVASITDIVVGGRDASSSSSSLCPAVGKCLVLRQVLATFEREGTKGILADRQNHRFFRIDYKRLIPLVGSGLKGCSAMMMMKQSSSSSSLSSSSSSKQVVETTWDLLVRVLSIMVSPIPMGNGMEKISRVQEVGELVRTILPEALPVVSSPSLFAAAGARLCEVLVQACSNCLEVAELHERCSIKHTDKEVAVKSKQHRDELIELFGECFEGCCKLQPNHPNLRAMSKKTVEGAVHVMFSSVEEGESYIMDATLSICQSIRTIDGVEALIPALFPSLCKLISTKDPKIRTAVAETLGAAKTARVLETAQTRFEDAERRAKEAEERANKVSDELRTLRPRKGKNGL